MSISLEKFLPPTPDELATLGKGAVTDAVDIGIDILRKPSEIAGKISENLKRFGP